MSISNNFPNIRPSLNLDFANTKQLDPRITFTRATGATYYDGKTFAKAEENLLLQSQEFDDASWGKVSTAVAANSTVAPDGTTTADTFDDQVDTGTHQVATTQLTLVSGQTYACSALLKNIDRQFVTLAASAAPTAWAAAKFDLSTGAVGSTSQAGAGWSTISSAIIESPVGSGWYRCSFIFVAGASGVTIRIGLATDGTTFTASERGVESYTGSDKKIYAWGAQLEQRSSVTAYTPTTTQPITNYIPVLLTAPANVPRFDHDPVTGESLGLEIEEQRTNLFQQSENFETTWTRTGILPFGSGSVVNAIIAPSGELTADKIVEDTANVSRFIRQPAISLLSATTYTLSFYAKAAGRSFVVLRGGNATTPFGVGNPYFGTFELSTGAAAVSYQGTAVNMTPVGNGWWRCSATTIATIAAGTADFDIMLASLGAYQGDGYSGIYIWGAQLEAGSFPTSYIKTEASAVTRLADSASMKGTNFSSWYRQDEGSFYANYLRRFISSGYVFGQNTEANNNGYIISQGATGVVNVSNADGLTAVELGTGNNGENKAAFGYSIGLSGVLNAGTPASSNAPRTRVPNSLHLGASRIDGVIINGHIRKLSYYPARLTNSQLQALTS